MKLLHVYMRQFKKSSCSVCNVYKKYIKCIKYILPSESSMFLLPLMRNVHFAFSLNSSLKAISGQ